MAGVPAPPPSGGVTVAPVASPTDARVSGLGCGLPTFASEPLSGRDRAHEWILSPMAVNGPAFKSASTLTAGSFYF